MHRTIRAFLIATTLLQPVAAWAQAPDEAGAKKIEEGVKTYGPQAFSKPGLVRVSPDGDGYRMALDMAKLIADAVAPMTVKEASPRLFKLVGQADGQWSFDSSGPFALTTEYLAANRSANLAVTTETAAIKGLFDPAIVFPRSADLGFTNGVATLRDSRDALKMGVKDAKLSSAVTDLPGGRGDIDGTFALTDLTATHGTFPQPEVKMSAERIEGTYKLGKLDLSGIAAMLRFWKVTAQGAEMATLTDPQRAELKALLAQHMPPIDAIVGKAVATNLATTEGGKGFRLAKLDYETRWEGMGDRAVFIVAAKLADLGVDAGVWPAGLEAILPKEAALNIKASGFDMGGMWKDAALVRSEKENLLLPRDHYAKIMLPDGRMTVDFTDSFVKSSFYDLTLSGQARLMTGQREKVAAEIVVTARNFDGTIKYLQDNTKTVPIFGRFAMMAAMAKGFAKPGPDASLVWEIKADEGGKITINGQPLPGR